MQAQYDRERDTRKTLTRKVIKKVKFSEKMRSYEI